MPDLAVPARQPIDLSDFGEPSALAVNAEAVPAGIDTSVPDTDLKDPNDADHSGGIHDPQNYSKPLTGGSHEVGNDWGKLEGAEAATIHVDSPGLKDLPPALSSEDFGNFKAFEGDVDPLQAGGQAVPINTWTGDGSTDLGSGPSAGEVLSAVAKPGEEDLTEIPVQESKPVMDLLDFPAEPENHFNQNKEDPTVIADQLIDEFGDFDERPQDTSARQVGYDSNSVSWDVEDPSKGTSTTQATSHQSNQGLDHISATPAPRNLLDITAAPNLASESDSFHDASSIQDTSLLSFASSFDGHGIASQSRIEACREFIRTCCKELRQTVSVMQCVVEKKNQGNEAYELLCISPKMPVYIQSVASVYKVAERVAWSLTLGGDVAYEAGIELKVEVTILGDQIVQLIMQADVAEWDQMWKMEVEAGEELRTSKSRQNHCVLCWVDLGLVGPVEGVVTWTGRKCHSSCLNWCLNRCSAWVVQGLMS